MPIQFRNFKKHQHIMLQCLLRQKSRRNAKNATSVTLETDLDAKHMRLPKMKATNLLIFNLECCFIIHILMC